MKTAAAHFVEGFMCCLKIMCLDMFGHMWVHILQAHCQFRATVKDQKPPPIDTWHNTRLTASDSASNVVCRAWEPALTQLRFGPKTMAHSAN